MKFPRSAEGRKEGEFEFGELYFTLRIQTFYL